MTQSQSRKEQPNTRKRTRGNHQEIIPQYRCAHHYNQRPAQCPNAKVISESVLERYLVENIRSKIEGVVLEYEARLAPVRDVSQQIADIEKKIRKLKELYVNDLIGIDEYKTDREEYLARIAELEESAQTPAETDLSGLLSVLPPNFEEVYTQMEKPEKRRFWRSIIREIRFDMERNIDLYF